MADSQDFKRVDGDEEDVGENTFGMLEDSRAGRTSWNETKTSGKVAIEASSTTYSRNSRFVLFVDNEFKTPEEFNQLVTEVPPLYELTVQPGETYVVQGKERNQYVPGLDYTSAFGSQFNDSGPEGQYTPDGVSIEVGLGDFKSGQLSNTAVQSAGQYEGVPLRFEPDEVTFGLYRDGNLENPKRLTENEWEMNPFESEKFEYDIEKFTVKREEGNFYGSGSQNIFFKLRDVDTGKEEYIKVAETGDDIEPAINQFNLFNTIRVDLDPDADPFTFSFGPLQYFNEGNIEVPQRRKRSTKRNLPVNDDFSSASGTVISVYRKDPDNVEVPIQIRCGGKAETNGRVEIREVHPNYVDFGTIDPTVDGNWNSPEGLRQRETGLQELDMSVGDVTLQSEGGEPRGEQGAVAEYDGQAQAGGSSSPTTSEDAERVSEYNYYVAAVKHQSTGQDMIRFDLFTLEEW